MEALAVLGGLVGLGVIGAVGLALTRFGWKESEKAAASYRLARSLKHARTDLSRTATHAWQQIYERVPELKHMASIAVLGQDGVDTIMADVMARYPAPPAVGQTVPCDAPQAGVASASTEQTPKGYRTVFFKDGEPTTLAEYAGQPHVTAYLQALVDGLDPHDVAPQEHQLFLGPPGMGKTLLARNYVNTLNLRNEELGLPAVHLQEEFPADLGTLQALDAAVRRASARPTALFIDEIHDLTDRHALKLYMLMEDGRYKYESEASPVEIPHLFLLGATTDYGKMHGALKRRFNRHVLEPMPRDQILLVVEGRNFPIARDAAEAIVERAHFSGAPWEALQLFGQARAFAKAAQRRRVEMADVLRVFESQKIDQLGLRWMDRRVIEVLLGQPRYRRASGAKNGEQEFVCYGASEQDVCAMANVDRGEYRESIKPRLMARQLLQVRATYGQTLRSRAVEVYGWLKAA